MPPFFANDSVSDACQIKLWPNAIVPTDQFKAARLFWFSLTSSEFKISMEILGVILN